MLRVYPQNNKGFINGEKVIYCIITLCESSVKLHLKYIINKLFVIDCW